MPRRPGRASADKSGRRGPIIGLHAYSLRRRATNRHGDLLFTDIEGSTRLLQELGPAYRTVLAKHHRLIRAAVGGYSGSEVKTEGDSFFVAFRSAGDGVRAAVDAQRALAGESWPTDVTIRVRMGLHTGEVGQLGDQYVGLDVHRAARIEAAAHGGQVLISEFTRELVADALPDGVSPARRSRSRRPRGRGTAALATHRSYG